MICPKCGGTVEPREEGNYVCLDCGAKFKKKAPTAQAEQPVIGDMALKPVPPVIGTKAEFEQPKEEIIVTPQPTSESDFSETCDYKEEKVNEDKPSESETDEVISLKARIADLERKQLVMEQKVNKAYKASVSGGALGVGKSGFTGSVFNLFIEKIFMAWMTLVTLGIAYPWLKCHYESFLASNTYVCGRRRTFDGTGWELAKKYLLWLFLSYVTFGIYGLWLSNNVRKWVTEHTHYEGMDGESYYDGKIIPLFLYKLLGSIAGIFTLGLAKSFFVCEREKYICEHTVIDGTNVTFNGSGMALLKKQVLWIALTVATCGVYAIWRDVQFMQWMASQVSSDDLTADVEIENSDGNAAALSAEEKEKREEKRREEEEKKRQLREQREQEKKEKKEKRKELHAKPQYKAFAGMISVAAILLVPALVLGIYAYVETPYSVDGFSAIVAFAIIIPVLMIALLVGCIISSKKLHKKSFLATSIVFIVCSVICMVLGFNGCSTISRFKDVDIFTFEDNGDGTYTVNILDAHDSDGTYDEILYLIAEGLDEIEIPSTHNGKPVTNFYCGYGTKGFTGKFIVPGSIIEVSQLPKYVTEVVLEDGIQRIGEDTFAYCENLTNITIPDTVKYIGSNAFACCRGLTSIAIPDNVAEISDHALAYCTNLTSVTFGENSRLTKIGDYAFCDCSKLTSITIPFNLTSLTSPFDISIGDYAFSDCTELSTIYFEGPRMLWNYILTKRNNRDLVGVTVICSDDNNSDESDGTSFDKAYIAESGQSYDVDITTGGQMVYFSFTPTTSGTYTIQSTGSSDTYGYLYSASQSELTSNDDGGNNRNFGITYNLTAGTTYYVVVKLYNSSNTGSFSVSFS